ncbi:dual specificity mitogen-activated protein kinase kinase 7-like isoform X2 [Schistocerca nitens]|uniref:dual specificity mitogen-activated protein kinase kinase 7-like isoform X2 n=1 Tax=Schistocerca nitens TaxID=7011 RepID=UPI002117A6EB|nr:dual specificity mitogen-activated protein kinase kinase 7-like isoform X2 [Schistocerca nitens]
MSNTPLENRILDLQARLKAENEARNRDKMPADLGNVTESPRQGSGRRPRALGEVTAPARPRGKLDLPVGYMAQQRNQNQEIDNKLKEIMKMNGILNINGKRYETDLKDLEHLGELGNGTYGHVVKMLHKPSQTVIAVKQMRRSGNSEENKRIIMDLDVVLKSHDCPFIVQCLGCYITESDVWIYMELMATCFDKLLKRLHEAIPEDILGKVTCATVKALHYLKETHGVIHRDVKPSNILLDEKGNVKLCDFGISGRLVDSKAKTRSAGCAAYMAPERIDPPDPTKPDYDIRADVWSLGITLVELATGTFPYRDCKNDFEVLSKVLQDEPPSLPVDKAFSEEFREFVKSCLTKNYKNRPKYKKLLEHPFLKKYEVAQVNVAAWFALAMQQCSSNSPVRRSGFLGSPVPGRKRFPSEPPQQQYCSPSPLALQRFYQQHMPLQNHHHQVNSYPTMQPALAPHQLNMEAADDSSKLDDSNGSSGVVKKRFASYLKFHLGGSESRRNLPPPRLSRNISPSPGAASVRQYSPARQSPEPPPRLSRISANSLDGGAAGSSPLTVRRGLLDVSPVRRSFAEGSPSLCRRYISPSPPQPPPRRLSESTSVPGSPQHRRVEHFRARFQYTPEPQRRVLEDL